MRSILAGVLVGGITAGYAIFGIWHARHDAGNACDQKHTVAIGEVLVLAGCPRK